MVADPQLGSRAAYARKFIPDRLFEHKQYIDKYGEDLPDIRKWEWSLGETQKGKLLEQKTRVN